MRWLLSYFLIKQFVGIELLKSATNIDVRSGEGFSGDMNCGDRISVVVKVSNIWTRFSTENRLFIKYYNGHMAHQILLHYAIELGAIVLLFFKIYLYSYQTKN